MSSVPASTLWSRCYDYHCQFPNDKTELQEKSLGQDLMAKSRFDPRFSRLKCVRLSPRRCEFWLDKNSRSAFLSNFLFSIGETCCVPSLLLKNVPLLKLIITKSLPAFLNPNLGTQSQIKSEEPSGASQTLRKYVQTSLLLVGKDSV